MKKGLDRTKNDQVNCLPQYKLHLKALNVYIKIKKGLVVTVYVINASTSKVLSFCISQCRNRTFIFIQQ